jgi:predicted outer membrane repeat protein
MLKNLKVILTVLFVISFTVPYLSAQSLAISDEDELNAAIAAGEDDLLITTQNFTLSGPVSITDYASVLSIEGSLTPTNFVSTSPLSVMDIQNSTVSFRNINFTNMDGNTFINADKSSLSFENALFEGNKSGPADSAFDFKSASNVNFSGSTNFISNSGVWGGGLRAEGGTLTFDGPTAFSFNEAGSGGGFFATSFFNIDTSMFEDAVIVFNGTAEFVSNKSKAVSGGGFSALGSQITFNDSASFRFNEAATDGGAGLISASTVYFSSPAVFEQNTAGRNGGALYVTINFADSVDFASGALFNGNEAAASGGAVYLFGSSMNVENANFTDNKAGDKGGAVFLLGDDEYGDYSELYVNTVNNGAGDNKTIFQGNKAAGQSNALYIGALSNVYFNTAAGASVEMYDAIAASTFSSLMSVSGSGAFNLYADSQLCDLQLSGGVFNIKDPARSLYADSVTADQNSEINMQNASNSNVLSVKNLDLDGFMKLDGGTGNGTGDLISAENVTLGSNSKLDVYADAAVSAAKNYRKRSYTIMHYANRIGAFGTVTFNNGLSLADVCTNPLSAVSYNDASYFMTISLTGLNLSTDFSSIAGLSYNQKQVAKTYDKLSSQVLSADLDQQITDIDSLANDDLKKDALSDSSGYFLANVIRSAASGSDSRDIYSRIRYHDMDAHNLSGIWAQARVQNSEINGDENSVNKYKDLEAGALAGWDIMLDDHNTAFGIYGKYNSQDIKQDKKNTAALQEIGVGVYGGFLQDDWEIKGLISGTVDNFKTERYISFADRKAEADFSGMTLGFDVEGAIRAYVTDSVLLRPFAGIEVKNTSYGSFDEKNAVDLSLQVESDSYTRSLARIGLGVGSDDDVQLEWYASVEGKYLLTSEEPEITALFATTSDSFVSRGAKEGSTIIGFAAGGSYRVSESFKVFANLNYQSSEGYQNMYGNLGVRYMLMGSGK